MTDNQQALIDAEIMTLQEAQDWKRRVSEHANELRLVLLDGYRRQVWTPLGYANWSECVRAIADEFGFGENYIWKLHTANQIQSNLLYKSTVDVIPEAQLRPLASLEPEQQREVWTYVTETAPQGKVTARIVQAAVNEIKMLHVSETVIDRDAREKYQHISDDSYEWYTPEKYIEAARNIMGGIDLDPASCAEAQEIVKAKKYYTKKENGLIKEWRGKVWLNPPYCMPEVEQFIDRVIDFHKREIISQAVILTNNSTDTAWFHRMLVYAGIACFTKGRVKFWGPDGGAANGARQGQVLFYIGGNTDKFIEKFKYLGAIVRAI